MTAERTAPWSEIEAQIEQAHDYNSTAEAAKDAAIKAFEFASDQCGLTGFQASWAILTAYGEAMHIDGPFMILRADDFLYPQYDLPKKLEDWRRSPEMVKWLAEQARERLAAHGLDEMVHPAVRARWEQLATEDR